MRQAMRTTARNSYDFLNDGAGEEKQGPHLLPDLEAMTPGEFERYLERIREKRKEFLPVRLNQLAAKDQAGWREDEGDFTLVNLGVSGHSVDTHGANMQASLVHDNITRSGSKALQANPHPLGGLYYSQHISSTPHHPTHGITYVDPRTTYPGRAVNKKNISQHRQDGLQAGFNAPVANNAPLVVSIGGLTAQSSTNSIQTADTSSISETDYTRTEPERGVGRFTMRTARLESLPTVVNLQSSDLSRRYGNNPVSKAKRASPMETFQFNIELELASAATRPNQGKQSLIPGSPEWVAREPGRRASLSRGDELGRRGEPLGSSKKDRIKGAALGGLKSEEAALRAAEKQATEGHRKRMDGLLHSIHKRSTGLRGTDGR